MRDHYLRSGSPPLAAAPEECSPKQRGLLSPVFALVGSRRVRPSLSSGAIAGARPGQPLTAGIITTELPRVEIDPLLG